MTLAYEESIEYLLIQTKKIPNKYLKIYSTILNALQLIDISEKIKIRQKRFILDVEFYSSFVSLDMYVQLKVADETLYDCFKYLIENNYFDDSSLNFPISKKIAQINKYHNFLNDDNFWIIDQIEDFVKSIKDTIAQFNKTVDKNQIDNVEAYIFLVLTVFNGTKFSKDDLNKLNVQDSFIRNEILYTVIFDKSFHKKFQPYHVIRIDEEFTNTIRNFWNYKLENSNQSLFNKGYHVLLKESNEIIKKLFKSERVNRNLVRRAFITKEIYQFKSPIQVSIKFNLIQMVPIILSELEALQKNSVPRHLLKVNACNKRYRKNHDIDDEFDDYYDQLLDVGGFDYDTHIAPLLYFNHHQKKTSLLSFDNKDVKKEYIESVIKQFDHAIFEKKEISIGIILKGIVFYLKRTIGPQLDENNDLKPKIEFQTFKDYLSLIKSNFLCYFEDIETFDESKLIFLKNILRRDKKSENTIKKVSGIIATITKLDKSKILEKKLFTDMPKSMLFEFEIDKILHKIKETYERKAIDKDKKTNTKHLRYAILQDQAFILLLFYTGLRKSELRTRLCQDIIPEKYDIYTGEAVENGYTIFVNMNGIKLDSKVTRLKTKNAKRKVFFAIQNKNHAKLLDEFLKASKNISTKTLFKEVELWNQNNENLNVTKSIMPYNKIVYLNKIIQNITKRYCTMHSLRASFATYRFEQRLFSKVKYTEEMLNFAVEMGHETSLITFQTYIHSNLIGEL